ncbi:hypothetical protein EDB19DRAFT_2043366 [Suillus lakei]|nr:hypothetical protein EDB19DRAFT_2043366 [Suillus lakei]
MPFKKSNKSSKQRAPVTEQSQDITVSQVLGITIAAINATKDLVPIDLAKGILGTIANILTIAQSVIQNESDILAIVEQFQTIRKVLERTTKDATKDDLQGSLGDALSALKISVDHMYSEAASKKEQRRWRRLLFVTTDRDQIAGWGKDLDRILLLFNFEVGAGVATDVKMIKRLALESKGNATSINAPKYRPTEPPSRPAMPYGRDDLVAKLTNHVVNGEHIALIGPGGMGKSSLAKAILNDPLVTEKFADRRFFVTCDGLDPSTITFETFMTRFAAALGIESAGADPVRQISTLLRSASALVVLDNAETFEEASASSALREIPQAIAEIADIHGVILILTSRSRRSAPNVPWITKDIPPLDSSSAQEAFFRIYRLASPGDAEGGITNLLQDLEFHPLSINLLANAAQQNGWSPPMLLERWKDRHSAVLDHGEGKLQSLSYTMQLSLSSPSIQKLGEEARHVLAVIAFLPQGLNESLSKHILSSTLQIDTISDVLWRQSLVYRQGGFVKMLAPIRHYVRDSLPAPDSTRLREIRTFYYRTIQWCSEERDGHADIIISDHLNIEHVVTFDLAHLPKETYPTCWQFLECLRWHHPRPTTLTPTISNIVESSSTWMLKAHCLSHLAGLYNTLSQLAEAAQACQAAEALYLTAGNPENMGNCLINRADLLRCQGRFIQSQNLLEDLQHSDSWKSLSEATKARAWLWLDIARMYTFAASADELFVKSSEDRVWGLDSKIWHWRVKIYYGGDAVQVKTHLEDLLLQCTSAGDVYDRRIALEGLADVAFCEGRLSDAMDNLQTLVEMSKGQNSEGVLCYTVRKAIVASNQGDHAFARQLIHKASEPSQFFALRNARTFLHLSHCSARIELAAGEYDVAESYFTAAIEGCDIQDNLRSKAYSFRGLGEVAFARSNFALAAERFAETRSLCTEMGVPPRHLYSCVPLYTLPDKFKGWALFLEGQSPFANIM